MTLAIRASNESSTLTTTSDSRSFPTNYLSTQTAPVRCPVFLVNPQSASPNVKNFTEVGALVAEHELIPSRRAALEAARRKLALKEVFKSENSLRSVRLSKGMSQAQLASLMGTAQSHIARIEGGNNDVQVSTLLKFADALGIDPMQTIQLYIQNVHVA